MQDISIDSITEMFFEVWKKRKAGKKLNKLERMTAKVIDMHPEYQGLLASKNKYTSMKKNRPNEPDPIGHMALHTILIEMISADDPEGLRSMYDQAVNLTGDKHMIQHKMMAGVFEYMIYAVEKQLTVFKTKKMYFLIKHQLRDIKGLS